MMKILVNNLSPSWLVVTGPVLMPRSHERAYPVWPSSAQTGSMIIHV